MLTQTEIQPCSGNTFRDDRLRVSYWSKVGVGVAGKRAGMCYFVQGDIREETLQSTLEPHGLRVSLTRLGNFCLFFMTDGQNLQTT